MDSHTSDRMWLLVFAWVISWILVVFTTFVVIADWLINTIWF